ncbi:CubicO group peptidase, beta-lactamase class C family [Seinonella peptonophila]|uniref:CubicO group peptidase, beta-lactamase class C family n=1 Tax=Seinonella peptonophila TaxID=112248 RepID=A0A1M4X5S2_9BACL|nr:serine hydrolase [Seinonella peptonophila]SHE88868.1 CubicO group peptidase, beta-lactamase class C family [Seinonella peptonophila]
MKKKIVSLSVASAFIFSLALNASAETANPVHKPVQQCRNPISDTYDVSKMATIFDESKMIWNFVNMDKILPHSIIKTGSKIQPFKKGKNVSLDKLTYQFKGETRKFTDLMKRSKTNGLLVIKDGKIVNEQYFNDNNECTRFTSWSVAKSYVSTLVGIAVDEGKIKSIDDIVTDYVPELKGSGYEEATIRDVLQMSSGIVWNEDYNNENSDIWRMLQDVVFNKMPIQDFIKELKSGQPHTFNYKSADSQVLTSLVEKVNKKPLHEVASEKLWKPLGMTSDAYLNQDLHNNDVGLSFINAPLRDFAKLGQLYLQNGKWNGKQIVSAKWIKEATTPVDADLQPNASYPHFGYQYQWWVPEGAKLGYEFSAIGVYGQYVYVNKDAGIVIAKVSADPDNDLNDYEEITAFREIAKAVSKKH